ncbi:MAG: tRNA pseudouridine(38-40) synthase TruA [Saprospiraceae bacterium]|nr:tRNA pseudouridine(38-40) synthase TruA [Saprospiraceae bacterium]
MAAESLRYFFHCAYRGGKYHGWQRQPDVLGVQQVLEEALSKVLKRRIICLGCGRTDAGVHASQYFFHIDVEEALPPELVFILNKVLPNDISIFDIISVPKIHHAQFGATARTYHYFIHQIKDPFLQDISAQYPCQEWDIGLMREALAMLPKYTDFRAFCKTPDRHDSTICDIHSVAIQSYEEGQKMRLQFTAKGFLKGMIRLLVGSLIAIGKGEMTIANWEESLSTGVRPTVFKSAYPQGLYLSRIEYPFLTVTPQGHFPF